MLLERRLKSRSLPLVRRLLAATPRGHAPSYLKLGLLSWAWMNPGYSASLRLLKHIARHVARNPGPVLECGSGMSTLLLGVLGQKHGVPVHVLEHHPDWAEHMRQIVRHHRLHTTTVLHAPLRSYGDFDWYDISSLPSESEYRMVVCDGPPGKSTGERFGLLPVVGQRLAADCRILLDDTHRRRERSIIQRWNGLRPLHSDQFGLIKRFSVLELG